MSEDVMAASQSGNDTELAHQLAAQVLPQLLVHTYGRGDIAGAALIEMLAALAESSRDPQRARAAWLQTIKERFAWSEDGGAA